MSKLLYGDRIGAQANLVAGACAAVFDAERRKVLLTRRTDNGRWCLPGGHMEAGESIVETCVREVREETGLEVRVVRLIGVYSTPHRIIEYADGKRYQFVSLHFEAEITGGALSLSDETTGYGFYSQDEIASMDVMEHHLERIADAFAGQSAAVVK